MMDKYKYQVIVIVLALLIGASLGSFITTKNNNKFVKQLEEKHQIELQKEIGLSKQRIQQLDGLLVEGRKRQQQDSLKITTLEKEIITSNKAIQKLRIDVSKMTTNEKVDFVLRRYNHSNQ